MICFGKAVVRRDRFARKIQGTAQSCDGVPQEPVGISGTGQLDCSFGSFPCPSRMTLIIQASGEALEGNRVALRVVPLLVAI